MNDGDRLAWQDLHEVLELGLEHGQWLLTAGELAVARRMLGLDEQSGAVYARLTARSPLAFEHARVLEDYPWCGSALDDLVARGLVDHLVPWPTRAALLTVPALREACRRVGVPHAGIKQALVERLAGHQHWHPGKWIRVRHRSLIRRLERWAFLRPHRDRTALVLERLEIRRWPTYVPTGGPGPHTDRRALLRWEALLQPNLTIEQGLQALARGDAMAGGRLDRSHRLARDLAATAQSLERTSPDEACAVYAALTEVGHAPSAVRHARALENSGRLEEAFAVLLAHRDLTGADRLAVHRAGRRMARRLRRGWRPDPPLKPPHRRAIRLLAGATIGSRPTYRVGTKELPVEEAIIQTLEHLGRRSLHSENGLWTTLFALLFADAYFAPVPGALPARWMAGPLDLGRPEFAQRRRSVIAPVLSTIRAGGAGDLLQISDQKWRGVRLAGARWNLSLSDLLAVAEGLGGPALETVMSTLLESGLHAARGLPDLAILPGPSVQFSDALPRTVEPELVLAEVKGPGDTVRDHQAWWFDRLRVAGARVALWEVRPLPGGDPPR